MNNNNNITTPAKADRCVSGARRAAARHAVERLPRLGQDDAAQSRPVEPRGAPRRRHRQRHVRYVKYLMC